MQLRMVNMTQFRHEKHAEATINEFRRHRKSYIRDSACTDLQTLSPTSASITFSDKRIFSGVNISNQLKMVLVFMAAI